MKLKKYTVVFSSIFLLITGAVIYGIACGGWEDPYDDRVTFFNNHVAGDPDYKPFYYIAYQSLYDYEEPYSDVMQNTEEWKKYLKTESVDGPIIAGIIYYNDEESLNILKNKQESDWPDSLKNNGFAVALAKKKNSAALDYLLFAKRCEPYVNMPYNEWDPQQPNTEAMDALIKEGEAAAATVKKDNYLQLRYGFQLCRLAHYSGNYEACLRLFESNVAPYKSESTVYYWALALKAGALRKVGKKEESAYLFSTVFSECKNKRIMAYQNVLYLSVYDKYNQNNVLALCKNNTEKANFLGVESLGSAGNELKQLEKMYKLDPRVPTLDVLLVREISKLENSYMSPSLALANPKDSLRLTTYGIVEASSLKIEEKYADSLYTFCNNVANDNKVKEPALWKISGAYIKFMRRDLVAAKASLKQAEGMKMSAKVRDQFEVLRMLITINEQQTIDASFEAKIYPSLKWLEEKRQQELSSKKENWDSDLPFTKIYKYLMLNILQPKYLSQKDRVSAALCVLQSEMVSTQMIEKAKKDNSIRWTIWTSVDFLRNSMNSAEVEKLIQVKNNATKTEYHQLMTNTLNAVGNDFLFELLGTCYLREYNFSKAVVAFKKLPAKYFEDEPYKTYLAANSFVDLITDTHAPTHRDTKKFTKLSFAQTMIAFEKKAKEDPKNAAFCYYQMANGFYNMSYNGNSWLLVNYYWSTTDREFNSKTDLPYLKDYYFNYTAEQYYLKALKLTTDNNLKAKCTFMAAKCLNSRVKYPNVPYDVENWSEQNDIAARKYYLMLINNKYFAELKKNYSTTPFYVTAVNECSYLRDFVRRR
ncbi:hypothetical protein D3C80_321100 [compost metagenome]